MSFQLVNYSNFNDFYENNFLNHFFILKRDYKIYHEVKSIPEKIELKLITTKTITQNTNSPLNSVNSYNFDWLWKNNIPDYITLNYNGANINNSNNGISISSINGPIINTYNYFTQPNLNLVGPTGTSLQTNYNIAGANGPNGPSNYESYNGLFGSVLNNKFSYN